MSYVLSKRGAERRHADYLIRTGGAVRRPMPPEQAAQLMDAIDNNKQAQFGVVKLSAVELDTLWEPLSRVGGLSGAGDMATEPRILPQRVTLIAYAAHRRRDAIVGKLLRAGADATARLLPDQGLPASASGCSDERGLELESGVGLSVGGSSDVATEHKGVEDGEAGRGVDCGAAPEPDAAAVRAFLEAVPRMYAMWVVREIVDMRHAGVSSETVSACARCHAKGRYQLPWGCGHSCCEGCAWGIVLSEGNVDGGLRCSACSFRRDGCSNTLKHVAYGAATPADIARASKERWAKLPSSRAEKVPKKPKQMARSLHETARLLPGFTQSMRNAKLMEAVVAKNIPRIVAMVEAGVDINARNEYGQTALYVAAWIGQDDVVHSLLAAGADATLRANGGSSPLSVATRCGHERCRKILDEATPSLDGALGTAVTTRSADVWQGCPDDVVVTTLIPTTMDHPGAGACTVDCHFSASFTDRLQQLWLTLPSAPPEKESFSSRSYFCDAEGWLRAALQTALRTSETEHGCTTVYPHMRFLHYATAGGYLAPHVDLQKRDRDGHASTHTFILYLEDCDVGGETALLEALVNRDGGDTSMKGVISCVKPRRGRLLVFPHCCPHEGRLVVDVPKLLLRGELR